LRLPGRRRRSGFPHVVARGQHRARLVCPAEQPEARALLLQAAAVEGGPMLGRSCPENARLDTLAEGMQKSKRRAPSGGCSCNITATKQQETFQSPGLWTQNSFPSGRVTGG
jgi:hypothetical protein